MKRSFSLAYLTSAPLSPLGSIALAAKLGFDCVGLRIMPATPGGEFSPLIEDKVLLKATRASLRDNGIKAFDIEIIRINEHFNVKAYAGFLETCSALEARAILVAGDDTDENRLIDHYAAFCAAAKPHGLTADLEFMPWTGVKTASQALRVVTKAGQDNGGILVDSLHYGRSESSVDDLSAIPRAMLHYTQIADAAAGTHFTVPELLKTARTERLFPGEGTIDIKGILAALPETLPISIEIPHDARKASMGIEAFVAEALQRSQAIA